MTNRELVQKAMPLFSLSKKEWSIFLKHLEDVERSEGEKDESSKNRSYGKLQRLLFRHS